MREEYSAPQGCAMQSLSEAGVQVQRSLEILRRLLEGWNRVEAGDGDGAPQREGAEQRKEMRKYQRAVRGEAVGGRREPGLLSRLAHLDVAQQLQRALLGLL